MNLGWYVAKRLLFVVPVLFGAILLTFFVSHIVPGDPVFAYLRGSDYARLPGTVEALRAKWGFDQPLYVQLFRYVANVFQGDLGFSIRSQKSVLSEVLYYLPNTLELATAAFIMAIIIGVPLGILAARRRRNKVIDSLARSYSLFGVSMPIFWLGLMLLMIFYYQLRILPGPGMLDPFISNPPRITGFLTLDCILSGDIVAFINSLQHLILPAFVLGSEGAAILSRITRSSMLEVLDQDYILAGRAKGLPENKVIYGHALKNALIPILSVAGPVYGGLLGGAVLTETIFGWPGIGKYAVASMGMLDYASILGVTVVACVIYLSINLIIDILYAWVDPRIKY